MTISQVSEKGQITLPASTRRKLGIQPRDRVSIEATDDAIIVKPVQDFFKLAGILGDAVVDEEQKAMDEVGARTSKEGS